MVAAAIATDARRRAFGIIIGKFSWKHFPAAVFEHKEVAPPLQLPMCPNLNMSTRSAKNRRQSPTEGWPAWQPQEESSMAQVEQKLASLGIVLPTPVAPIANYVGVVRTRSLLVVCRQLGL